MVCNFNALENKYNGECFETDLLKAHKNAIEAAVAAGVKYIFYSSLAFASGLGSSSSNQIMQAHLLTEKYLHEQAVAGRLSYTCIREGIYSESFPLYLAALDLERPAHDILIPHSGSGPGIAWVKTDELGEATANLIISCAKNVGNFPYRNQTMLLSGCQELSLNDTVDIVAEITQRPLAIRETSVEASLGAIMARPVNPIATGYRGGGPEAYASLFESIKNGEAATTSTVLGELLGREPERFAVTAREMIKSISSSL